MSKLPIPPRSRPLYAKGGEANQPALARTRNRPDKSQPRPSQSEDGAKPERNTVLIGVWLKPSVLARLDKHRGGKTRPQAIREILEKNL